MTQRGHDPTLGNLHADFDFGFAQSCQLHMIPSIRNGFESFIPSIRFAASLFVSLFPRNSGARTG